MFFFSCNPIKIYAVSIERIINFVIKIYVIQGGSFEIHSLVPFWVTSLS